MLVSVSGKCNSPAVNASCILPQNKAAGGMQRCYCFRMDGVQEATGIRWHLNRDLKQGGEGRADLGEEFRRQRLRGQSP